MTTPDPKKMSLEELLSNAERSNALGAWPSAIEMARRLRALVKWAEPRRHGHSTEQAAAEVRRILEGGEP